MQEGEQKRHQEKHTVNEWEWWKKTKNKWYMIFYRNQKSFKSPFAISVIEVISSLQIEKQFAFWVYQSKNEQPGVNTD